MMSSNLESEIYQQPAVLQRFLDEKAEGVARLAEIIRADAPRFFVIAARGTSDNAATYAKYIFAALNGHQGAGHAISLHAV
jgi:glucosamine--fructose-6-phosphate aminotransferase (isomerizing)